MKWWLSLCGVSLIAWVCLGGERGLPAKEGIKNFGKVNESLYRGAQPDEVGITNLSRLGVKTIINLRMPDDSWKAEESAARNCGLTFTNVPFKGMGRPTHAQIQQVLAIIETAPSPVFVHCAHGCDRTGTVVACYRIKHDRWSTESALREARLYGMSKLERGMRRYVLDFGSEPNQQSRSLAAGSLPSSSRTAVSR